MRIRKPLAPPRNRPLARIAGRILRQLARFDRAGSTSKQLARELGLPLRTVQYNLAALVRDDVIQEPYRGRFVYAPNVPDILTDPAGQEGIHGLVIATSALRGDLLRRILLQRYPKLQQSIGSRYGEEILSWEDHVVRVRFYPSTGRLLVYVPSTRLPIRFGAFGEFVGWLTGVLHPLRPDLLEVVQVGVHVDYGSWTLKGIRAVELRRFLNAAEQLYQKVGAVRHEVHLVPRELSLEQAVRIIREGSPTAQLERLFRTQLEIERQSAKPAPGTTFRDPTAQEPGDAVRDGYA